MMLDSHPDLAIPPETQFIPGAANACRTAQNPLESSLQTLIAFPTWPDFHLDEELLKARVRAIHPFVLADALRVFYRLYAERFGKPRWGDKTRVHAMDVSLIRQLLPEA